MEKLKRFVVLATPRTGSNMLMQTLDSHPQIKCYGELFRQGINPKNIASGKGRGAAIKIVKNLNEEFWNPDYRYQHAMEFLENVVNFSDSSSHVGFKLMLGSKSSSLTEELMKSEDYQIILLKRSNMMAVYSSNEIARATGQGAARKNDTIKTAQIKFEAASFEQFSQRRVRQYKKIRELLESSKKNFFEIEYNQLRDGEGLKQVLGFLGVDPNQELTIPTKKRNSDSMLERFNNPEVVSAYANEKGLQEWLVENAKTLSMV